ncbi:MAG: NUDIX domain-containing protein, partial [Rhodospirillaceae bacterium]|nr:NUDIX domain-containing protein [Rhodospirillaceae bacterium]
MSRTYPDRPWVGVGVIVVRGTTEVLLIQRAQPPNQGQWTLPGGGQDLGET